MPKLSETARVRECCHRIAKHSLDSWKEQYKTRKNDDYTQVAIAFDDEDGGAIMLFLRIDWKVLKTVTHPQLCNDIFEAVTAFAPGADPVIQVKRGAVH